MSEFEELRPGVARASEGFVVENLGVSYLIYRDGERVIKFPIELGKVITYYLTNPRWEHPFLYEEIPAAEIRRIQERVVRFLRWRGDEFVTDLP